MKRLLILRHAKSSWSDASLADFDRPLNDRGRCAAPFMGELIAKRALLPQIIYSSPAERAKQTAQLVNKSSGNSANITYDDRIYEASSRALVEVASGFSDEFGSVMIVGHNPGMEGFVRTLTGQPVRMPTAALAVIDADIHSWSDIGPETSVLVELVRPKEQMT